MARSKSRIPLNVLLNGRLVGHLRRHTSGAIDFQYDETWLAWEHTFPISLSLPLREDRYSGDPVIAVIDNLLPDNDKIRRTLAERVQAEGYDAYNLLAAVGRDCVGALQFLPEDVEASVVGSISAAPISDSKIAEIITNLETSPLGVATEGDFRISLAGAQEKTALLYWKDAWHIPHGSTPTTHILKPQIGKLPSGIDLSQSVENEHICMKLTAAFGIPTAPTEILDFDDQRVLAVERFDRQWTKDDRLLRRPQEDLCQALSVPPTLKYEADGGPGITKILEFLKASDEHEKDQELFLKAQIVFWLLAATDGHAKNFSISINPGGGFKLTPLYDVMSAQPYFDAGQIQRNGLKLAMAVAGKNRHYKIESILPRHFIQTAEAVGYPPNLTKTIMADIQEVAPKAIESVQNGLPQEFPEDMADSIISGLKLRLATIEKFLN